MIKQSLLDSLEGLTTDAATKIAKDAGHKVWLIPEGVDAIPLLAMPNTVILWQENGKVATAQAGDGLELEDE